METFKLSVQGKFLQMKIYRTRVVDEEDINPSINVGFK